MPGAARKQSVSERRHRFSRRRFPTLVLTRADVHALIREHGLRPSKALGQSFLADPNTARRIVRLAGVGSGDRVLEIGPGIGSLTLALAAAGAEVLALELDRRLVPVLRDVVRGTSGVTVEEADALGYDYARLGVGPPTEEPWVCVSNLPYRVAAPLVATLLHDAPQVTRIVVMVQREVGKRLVAAPGTRASGGISVVVAYFAEARVVASVPATVFVPKPKVESVVVELVRRPQPAVEVPEPEAMFALVRAGFGQRRKMLRRSLRASLGERTEAVLGAAGIPPTTRAERLVLDDWARLARAAA